VVTKAGLTVFKHVILIRCRIGHDRFTYSCCERTTNDWNVFRVIPIIHWNMF